jgi:hypothetical protein
MKIRLCFVLICFCFVFPVVAQDDPAMQAMMKAATPGENHQILAKLVGDWKFTNKMWTAPGQPPTESPGTMHAESILGGRYIHSVWKGDMMGMPFEGHGTDGYDNVTKQFVSSWVDNMGTGILYSTGSCDSEKKICTSTGEMMDPVTNQKITIKSVSTWSDDNQFIMEMYSKDASGQETKMMEMTVTRN